MGKLVPRYPAQAEPGRINPTSVGKLGLAEREHARRAGINPTSVGKLLAGQPHVASLPGINPTSVGKLLRALTGDRVDQGINPTSVGKLELWLLKLNGSAGSTPQVWGNFLPPAGTLEET